MSHNILTGFWKKKKWDQKNLWKFLHEITPAQLSFAMEVVNQNLGKKPSKYWGHQKINIKIPQSKETLEYFLSACKHPRHIMSQKFSEHPKAAGSWAAVGEAVVSGGRAMGRTVVRAARYLGAHASQIMHGVGTALQLGATGVQLAASVGLLDPETDSTLIGLANITSQIAGQYDENKEEQAATAKKEAGTETKKGSSFYEKHPSFLTSVFEPEKAAREEKANAAYNESVRQSARIHKRGYLTKNPFLHIS